MQKAQFKIHIVKKGESLQQIARLYRVDTEPIREINRLTKTSRLSTGMNLLIPVPKTQEIKPILASKGTPNKKSLPPKSEEITYTIKKGDSLWSIANEMGVNIGALSQWNHIHPEKKIIPGDKLKIKMVNAPDPSDKSLGMMKRKEIVYVVKEGDSLWSIAQKFNLTISEIKTWNQINGGDLIHPSDRLKLRVGGIKSSTLN
jgi:membrane-bound lytic murein transglycosylase D